MEAEAEATQGVIKVSCHNLKKTKKEYLFLSDNTLKQN